jgi:hypothetical protein
VVVYQYLTKKEIKEISRADNSDPLSPTWIEGPGLTLGFSIWFI